MSTRWQDTEAPRGDDYDARWRALAASGQSIHGEADLVEALLGDTGGTRVLDAGCGTGCVAIELAAPGGLLVSGFSIHPDRLSLNRYDELAEQAGLQPVARWATWSRDRFSGGAVSVHRRPAP